MNGSGFQLPPISVMRRLILIVLIIAASLLTWVGEERSFYSLKNGTCITVWKTYGGVCYILPYKYFGVSAPQNDYILTANSQYITLYLFDSLPTTIVVKNQGSATGADGSFRVFNKDNSEWHIKRYSEKYRRMVFDSNQSSDLQLKKGVELIDIDIFENYAIDKSGQKL